MKRYASTALFDSSMDRVLLIANNEGPYAAKWNIIGGKIEDNEATDEAAIRELQEESHCYHDDLATFKPLVTLLFPEVELNVYYGILAPAMLTIWDNGLSSEEGFLHWFNVGNVHQDHKIFAGEGNLPYFIYYARFLEGKA